MATPAVPTLPESVTLADARTCLSTLQAQSEAVVSALAEGAALVVDASSVERFDSSALAVLLECRKVAVRHHRGFAVRGLPQRLRELSRLYGVAGLLLDEHA